VQGYVIVKESIIGRKPIFACQTAEDRYLNELVAHAESIQIIETLRKSKDWPAAQKLG